MISLAEMQARSMKRAPKGCASHWTHVDSQRQTCGKIHFTINGKPAECVASGSESFQVYPLTDRARWRLRWKARLGSGEPAANLTEWK